MLITILNQKKIMMRFELHTYVKNNDDKYYYVYLMEKSFFKWKTSELLINYKKIRGHVPKDTVYINIQDSNFGYYIFSTREEALEAINQRWGKQQKSDTIEVIIK